MTFVPTASWLAGFWLADGSLAQARGNVVFSQKDREMLEVIKKELHRLPSAIYAGSGADNLVFFWPQNKPLIRMLRGHMPFNTPKIYNLETMGGPQELSPRFASWEWAAGFHDGDGHAGYHGSLLVRIGQLEEQPLLYLDSLVPMPNGLNRGPKQANGKTPYVYSIYGERALKYIRNVYPHLYYTKQKQIREALIKADLDIGEILGYNIVTG